MRKNSKNEKVIRAMAIGISAMLMASSPLTALAAEGEGTTPEGNEDKNITVTPEAGIADQAQAAAKEADKAVETAEKSATDVKSEVADQVVAGEAKDTQGKDLSQAVLRRKAYHLLLQRQVWYLHSPQQTLRPSEKNRPPRSYPLLWHWHPEQPETDREYQGCCFYHRCQCDI